MAGACRTCRTVPQTTPQRRLLILCDMRNEARASSYKVETAHDPRRDTDIEEGGGNCAWSIDRDVARKRVVNTCAQQLEGADMISRRSVAISSPEDRGRPWIIRLVMRLTKRSEEHTSELQSLMRISYAVFCL